MIDSRIIVALDFADADQALRLASQFSPKLCRLKVGLELFTSAGPNIVSRLMDMGFDVFLDLKFHDIPNTVARACRVAAKLKVWMINVHVLGSDKMLRAAREAIDTSEHKPLLTGVTILTSHSAEDLHKVSLSKETTELVRDLAGLSHDAGLDGIICSPHEASAMRNRFGPKFILVTPGIRSEDSPADDQQRVMTATQALAAGADYLVIGRPITASNNPRAALDEIMDQINKIEA